MDLKNLISRMAGFSVVTFGPGARTLGLCDHLSKEIKEIKEDPDDGDKAREWADIVILGLDGMWRELHYQGVPWGEIPHIVESYILHKQGVNEKRKWPDWRTAEPGKAIEHVRD
jgi:hypothetical protein